jgi:hypothetical protein
LVFKFDILTQALAEGEMRRRDLILGVAATPFAVAGHAFSQQIRKYWDPESVHKMIQSALKGMPNPDCVGILAATPATDGGYGEALVEGLQPLAMKTGLRLVPVLVDGPDAFESAFETISKAGARVVIIEEFFAPHRVMFQDLQKKYHFLVTLSLLPRTD